MTLTQLKNFIAVAESGSFTRAAELNMTAQPAISYSVKSLEDEMGGHLLARSTRSVKLTEAGQWFYGEAKEIVKKMEAACEHVRSLSMGNGSLTIGYSGLSDSDSLLSLIDDFRLRYPDASIKLVRRDMTLRLFEGLISGELDLAYCFDIPDLRGGEVLTRVLGKSMRYAILPRDHKLADRKFLFVNDLKGETLLIFKHNPNFGGILQFPNMQTLDVADIESMELLIAAHVGITVLPMANTGKFEKLIAIPIKAEDGSWMDETNLVVAWSSKTHNPLVSSLLDTINK